MKSGYLEESQEEQKLSNSVSISEQETNILYMRDENFAMIYTSDTTQMTKLDKLCISSPEFYSLVSDTGRGKTYRCSDKSLISYRSKKRELTEEQRKASGDRMRQYQASKKK